MKAWGSSRSKVSRACVEALEDRRLLSADLTGSFFGTVPTSLKVTGNNHVTVRISNVGSSLASGSATVALYVSSDTTLDSGDTPLLPAVTRHILLKPNGFTNVPMTFASPTVVPTGNYYLLADITPSAAVGDSNAANNVVATANTLSIQQPFVDLTDSVATGISGTIAIVAKRQKTVSPSIVVTNAGNVTAKGLLKLNLYAGYQTTLSNSDTLLISKSLGNVAITAGKSRKYVIRITPNASDPSGTFYLLADVNPTATISESNTTNNVASSLGTFIISNPAIPPGPRLTTGLLASTSAVVVGSSELTTFTVTVAGATPSTAVEVDEFDANGNNLGKLTDVYDNGSAGNGDLVAGDGTYSGINTVGFSAPGTRYFAAVVSDPSLAAPLTTAKISIVGSTALSSDQVQADMTDETSLDQVPNGIITSGGSISAALSALKTALSTDPTVVPSSIQSTPLNVEWTNLDGITFLYDATATTAASIRGGGAAAPLASSVSAASPVQTNTLVPLDTSSDDATGNAIVLAPYQWNFGNTDESTSIASMFQTAGYNVVLHQDTTSTSTAVSLSDFENLGQYDAVVITAHGGQLPGGGEDILTGVQTNILTSIAYLGDLWNDRLVVESIAANPGVSYYAVTPSFISVHTGSMNGSIVYVGSCYSAFDTEMADAFIDNGAAAYIGYTDEVGSTFAFNHGVSTFSTLLQDTDNTVGDIPGINSDVDNSVAGHAAKFVAYNGQSALDATLPQGLLLKNYEVYVQYNWPQNVADLDTRTTFLGNSAGWDLAGGPYIDWGGDNTGYGGSETTTVDIYQAWLDGQYTGTTTVGAGADWYTPHGGSGPAYMTIALENVNTGVLKEVAQENVNPGQEDAGTTDTQFIIQVTLGGNSTDPTVKISVSPTS